MWSLFIQRQKRQQLKQVLTNTHSSQLITSKFLFTTKNSTHYSWLKFQPFSTSDLALSFNCLFADKVCKICLSEKFIFMVVWSVFTSTIVLGKVSKKNLKNKKFNPPPYIWSRCWKYVVFFLIFKSFHRS